MIGKLLCKVFGHKRGRNVGAQGDPANGVVRVYACPRCTATWTRKVKVKP